MNNMQYKVVNVLGGTTSVFTNDAYDMVHDSSINSLSINYKTDDLNLIINNLIINLVKTNNEINNIVSVVNSLVINNIITQEIGNYILQNLNINDYSNQYKKM